MTSVFRNLFAKPSQKSALDAALPDGVRVYAIGDIHGRMDLVQNLHAAMAEDLRQNPVSHSVEIYLGDYVDRGPASNEVLETLSARPPICNERLCLKGNHEVTVLRFLEDAEILTGWKRYGGLETLMAYGVKASLPLDQQQLADLHAAFVEKFPSAHRAFIERLPVSKTIGDYFFVHAGVRPGVPLDEQEEKDMLWIREPFLDATGAFEKMIVHGHTPVEEPEFHSNRINIDTGAYVSGRLTCLVLEGRETKILPSLI